MLSRFWIVNARLCHDRPPTRRLALSLRLSAILAVHRICKFTAAFAAFDLAPVLADAGEIYEAAAEARGLRLATDLPETLELSGDRDLLLQAVANLLDNAIKFTPPGGTIEVRAFIRDRWPR